ncbi:MAG: proton-coupled thiamine transporter YuaJ [Clostridiales bacterium]|jgi:thiamine transporter|nr:proton-coupled thiamine transporter YuaJ [Clostridiales bacterium]
MKTRKEIITLCYAAVSVAMSFVLSFVEIPVGFQGGSINFVMIPLIVFAVYRGGLIWGLGAGAVFGTLKLLTGSSAVTWASILLDYTFAYAAVGLAGIFKGRKYGGILGALTGCVARFAVHFISGITIYAINAPSEVLGITTSSVLLFSFLYNIAYMGPNTVAAVVLSPVLGVAVTGFGSSARKTR